MRWPLPGAADIIGAMAAPPDLASLAKRYIDLWQDQLIAMAADPDLAGDFARLMGALAPMAWPPATGDGRVGGQPVGAAAAATARRECSGGLDELARRLDAVEERLAALEAGARRRGKRAPPKRRRRSA